MLYYIIVAVGRRHSRGRMDKQINQLCINKMELIKSASPLDDGGWLVDGRWEPDDLELMQIPVCLSDPLRVVDPTGCFFIFLSPLLP